MQRALISVSDKTGIDAFAKGLARHGLQILSTGGTAKALRGAGVEVVDVSEHTGSPEILDGRVKTLHPRVHGGLLFRRDLPEQVEEAARHNIPPIDLVVVNLYPFQATVAKPDCAFEDAIENIDIGGPTMIRSAAKNHQAVAVVTDPADYAALLAEMDAEQGGLSGETRYRLAQKAFRHTAQYDMAISHYLEGRVASPPRFHFGEYSLVEPLSQGENPHQRAALYGIVGCDPRAGIPQATRHGGRALSYRDVVDLEVGLQLLHDFREPTAAVILFKNPCGVASHPGDIGQALFDAWAGDPLAEYGATVAVNQPVDARLAKAILASPGVECVLAPLFGADALAMLNSKPSLRLVQVDAIGAGSMGPKKTYRFIEGGVLVQDSDQVLVNEADLKVVSKLSPGKRIMESLIFAFRVCKQVSSQAVVLAQGTKTVGIGAGQMTRVTAARVAAFKAGRRSEGAVMACDGPIRIADAIHAAADRGVKAVIQPGGAEHDDAVIAAADKHGIAMVLTGVSHLRH